jgi:hypothetical protein
VMDVIITAAKRVPSYSRNRRQEATNFYFASAGWPALHTENGSPARSVFRP